MNITFQNGQFVGMTRSGRRYFGATAEEAERKYLLAYLHAYGRQVGMPVLREIAAANFGGVCSLGDLAITEMRELKTMVEDAVRFGRREADRARLEPRLTDKQRRRIIRLGRYVIGERYGKDWFWRNLKEWTKKSRIEDLTVAEAHYVIKRMEKIEYGMHRRKAS